MRDVAEPIEAARSRAVAALTKSGKADNQVHGGGLLVSTGKSAAPLYHFQIRTATHVMHTEGVRLADATAARIEASRRIGDLLKGTCWSDMGRPDWQIDVTDQTGLILYVINVSAMKTAATQNEHFRFGMTPTQSRGPLDSLSRRTK
jgi:hypothetical protein